LEVQNNNFNGGQQWQITQVNKAVDAVLHRWIQKHAGELPLVAEE